MENWPYNYHCHTPYGDGHSPAAEIVAEAYGRGMRCIGISEHAPLGSDIDWTMAEQDLDAYRSELLGLRRQYEDWMEVACGLECDWWPARGEWWTRINPKSWDYRIGSVHFITGPGGVWQVDNTPPLFEAGVQTAFGGDMRAACDAFFAMERATAASGRFEILGHFDLVKKFNKNSRYFDSTATWYREMASTVVESAASSDIIVEINTAGLDKSVGEYYPAAWLIERCVARGVRLTLSADAHRASEIQRHFPRVLHELTGMGVTDLWRWEAGVWGSVRIAA